MYLQIFDKRIDLTSDKKGLSADRFLLGQAKRKASGITYLQIIKSLLTYETEAKEAIKIPVLPSFHFH